MAGFFSRLFGRAGDAEAVAQGADGASVDYNGFTITPRPEKATGGWRIGARIEKDLAGARQRHDLVRADVIQDREAAEQASTAKARQMIDEQGDRLFD